MSEARDITDVVDEHLPYDGPHSRDSVIDAARMMAYSLRYLNNATQHTTTTLYWGNTVHAILGSVNAALHGLDQLFDQLGTALDQLAADPTLYDDRRQGHSGAETARDTARMLAEAKHALKVPRARVEQAFSQSSHLGNEDH